MNTDRLYDRMSYTRRQGVMMTLVETANQVVENILGVLTKPELQNLGKLYQLGLDFVGRMGAEKTAEADGWDWEEATRDYVLDSHHFSRNKLARKLQWLYMCQALPTGSMNWDWNWEHGEWINNCSYGRPFMMANFEYWHEGPFKVDGQKFWNWAEGERLANIKAGEIFEQQDKAETINAMDWGLTL